MNLIFLCLFFHLSNFIIKKVWSRYIFDKKWDCLMSLYFYRIFLICRIVLFYKGLTMKLSWVYNWNTFILVWKLHKKSHFTLRSSSSSWPSFQYSSKCCSLILWIRICIFTLNYFANWRIRRTYAIIQYANISIIAARGKWV